MFSLNGENMYSGKRSPEAQKKREQRKAAREYIMKFMFNDYLISEQVSRSDPEEVQSFLAGAFGYVAIRNCPSQDPIHCHVA